MRLVLENGGDGFSYETTCYAVAFTSLSEVIFIIRFRLALLPILSRFESSSGDESELSLLCSRVETSVFSGRNTILSVHEIRLLQKELLGVLNRVSPELESVFASSLSVEMEQDFQFSVFGQSLNLEELKESRAPWSQVVKTTNERTRITVRWTSNRGEGSSSSDLSTFLRKRDRSESAASLGDSSSLVDAPPAKRRRLSRLPGRGRGRGRGHPVLRVPRHCILPLSRMDELKKSNVLIAKLKRKDLQRFILLVDGCSDQRQALRNVRAENDDFDLFVKELLHILGHRELSARDYESVSGQ